MLVGILAYGITFLIIGLVILIYFFLLAARISPEGEDWHFIWSYVFLIFMIPATISILLGITILLRRHRLCIIIVAVLLILINICFLTELLVGEVSYPGPFNWFLITVHIIPILFFISVIYYFTRPKVKEQFK